MANHQKISTATVVSLFRKGVSLSEIARRYGMALASIQERLQRLGAYVPTQAPKRLASRDRARVAAMYKRRVPSSEIAKSFGVAVATVRVIAREYGCKVNPRGQMYRAFTKRERAKMLRMWNAGFSMANIANELEAGHDTIGSIMRSMGAKPSPRMWGQNHPNWKGGRLTTSGGYIRVLLPFNHEWAHMCDRSGYVAEHRLVLSKQLGRALDKCESVHHINGDHADNRPENLQLRHGKHGTGVALKCADCGSCNIVHNNI